jgi:hypothetical protein
MNSVHTFNGVNLDSDPRGLQPNELSYAKDNEFYGTEGGKDGSSYPLASSSQEFTIPAIEAQYQYVRYKFDDTAISYTLTIKDSSGNSVGPNTFTITVASLGSPDVSGFVDAIDTILTPYGFRATYDSVDGLWFSLAIYQGAGTPIYFDITESETTSSGTSFINIYTIQDYFNPLGAAQAQLQSLQTIQVNTNLFVFSKSIDGEAKSIGVATKDNNGVWTYASLIVTRALDFPTNNVIEIQAEEVNNNQFGIYWVTNTGKPKSVYVPTDLSSPLKYTMSSLSTPTSGLFTLESLEQQSNTQIQNFSRIEYSNQIQSGGSLEAGTWIYFVAAGIARNYSEWSAPSEPIPVFTESTNSPTGGSVIEGDKTPAKTGKINELSISGVDSKVYDTIRVAAMVNQGGAYSSFIIGEFDTVPNGNTFVIRHSGLEPTIEEYDNALLPPVQELILNSKNIQIKKNRLNYANIEVQVEEDLDGLFDNITLGQTTETIASIGALEFSSEPLFRAGLDASYSITTVGQLAVTFQNDSTNGNFDNAAVFNLGSSIFTVPTTGTYSLSISHSFGLPSEIELYPKEIYILNQTTGDRYCLTTNTSPSLARFQVLNNTQSVTLTAGDNLVCAVFSERETGSGGYEVTQFVWSANRAIANYPTKSLRVGEYQLPENVATKTGYMVNEKYAFYARVKYKTGYLSKWRFIGDYQFDNGTFPSAALDGFLTDGTSISTSNVNVYGLTIDNINVDLYKETIDYIEIGRAICNPTILGTGIFIASDSATGGSGGYFTSGLYTGNTDATTYRASNSLTSDNRLFGTMLCIDWATGSIKPQFQDGDSLIVYGVNSGTKSQIIGGGSNKFGSFWEFSGVFLGSGQSYIIDIADAAYTPWNTQSRVLRNDTNNLYLSASLSNDGTIATLSAESMAITLESKIVPLTGTSSFLDNGMYYVQYYRPNSNQYNEIDVNVVSCNHFIDLDSSSPDIIPQQIVFGGDTYTQKSYMKVLYNAKNPDASDPKYVNSALTSFIGFYSQNKINEQMRFNDKTFSNQPFPFSNTLDKYLFGTYDAGEQFQIDAGYTWENILFNEMPYNPKLPRQSRFKSRIVYSQQKPLNSLEDTYRILLPNDFKDLDAKDGEINGLYDVNDTMIALQPFAISVLPYDSNAALSSTDGSIYVGNGGVYAQRERKISIYGPSIKSGTLLAENEAGNSVVYWFSANGRGLFRAGNDGVKNLSDENKWRTWFFGNTNLINNEYDVTFGFDRTRSLIFMTARAVNTSVSVWNSATTYTIGQVVRYGATNKYQNFENLPDVYISKGTNTNVNPYDNTTTGGSTDWEYVQPTDNRYYNYWSCMYNEKKNWFQGFFSLLVSRYFYYNGEIFVPRGRAPFNIVYSLFGGDSILQWLDNGGVYKQGSFELEWVSTRGLVPTRYQWIGLQVGTGHNEANNPIVSVTTETQTSATVGGSEMEYLNAQLAVGVYPDIHNDDPIISDYAKIRLTSTLFYRIYSLISNFYVKARTNFK